jgi:AmiR/NasT family two-component response regulator
METKVESTAKPMNVLLIGNNPIDMSRTLEKINAIRGRKIITEIAFDLQSIVERLMRFHPNFILIDDNIGRAELAETVHTLSHNRKTKDIPITILKNSNYQESSTSNSVMGYILKQNFSSESLYTTLLNSLKFRKTQQYLYKVYQKRKSQLRMKLSF